MVANVVSVLCGETRLAFFTYLLECSNGSLYAGWTVDIGKRIEQHNAGKGAKYTRALRPVKLAASWEFSTKPEAMSFEWHLKQMSRLEKLRLIQERDTYHAPERARTTGS